MKENMTAYLLINFDTGKEVQILPLAKRGYDV